MVRAPLAPFYNSSGERDRSWAPSIFAGRWVGFATKQKSGNYGAHLTLV